MNAPTLVAVAHGTRADEGIAELTRLVELVRDQLDRAGDQHVAVELCYVDVVGPSLADTLAGLTGAAVVVPLLLATGYHVGQDIPRMVGERPATVVTAPIGPDEQVSRAMQARLQDARQRSGVAPADVLVVAAGSSDPAAREQLASVAEHLGAWNPAGVRFAQLTEDDPLAALGEQTQLASYLLAPGYFHSSLRRQAPGRLISDPIGAHPLVARVILDRYRAAVAALR
jgi:sirohydrochlorin ferrochelatase